MKTYPSVDWRQVVCGRGRGGPRDGWGGCDQGSDSTLQHQDHVFGLDLGIVGDRWTALEGAVGRREV